MFEVFINIYNTNPEVKLLIVGPFEMTQIKDTSLVQKINKHPGVINYGRVRQEEVPGFMLAMDVFVLPAWWEGFGNTLVQAAAMGVPVISTTGTGTIDAVSDGYNGILIPIKNKSKLEEAMRKMMNGDKQINEFGENGVKWAQNFDRKIIWDAMHKLYQNTCNY